MGYRPRNYDYPYLGYKEQQDQYLENNYNPTFWERLTGTREKDDNEEYYLAEYAWKKYENGTEWERNVGTTALIGVTAGYIALEAAPIISSCLSQPMICANQLGMFAIDTIGAEAAPMGFSAGAGYLGKKLTQKEINVLVEAMQKDKEFAQKMTAALTNEIIKVDKNISYDTSKNIIKLLENNANKVGKGIDVTHTEKLAAQTQQELINEINKFSSKNQAARNATMVGAYDPITGNRVIGYSNANISAEALHPETVKYIEQQLGVKIGEFTSFCKNKAGACAEVSGADKLIRMGSKPENIRFTDALRPRDVWGKDKIPSSAIIPPCQNCQITWPKGKK